MSLLTAFPIGRYAGSMFTNVLVAVDESECAARALGVAIDLAASQRAKLVVVYVVDPLRAVPPIADPSAVAEPWLVELADMGTALLKEAGDRARAGGVTDVATELLDGPPAATIVRCARDRSCDVIVVGSHGRKGLSRLVLGSVAEGVMRDAPCPVLVVHDA